MLRNLVKGLSIRSVTKCRTLYIPMQRLHDDTIKLREKHEHRKHMGCPASQTEDCRTIKVHPCSPTNPSVRPCGEQDCPETPAYSCCVNTRIAQNICEKPVHAAEFKRKPNKFMSMWPKPRDMKHEEFLMWNYPPECCPKCPDIPFDVMYYRPSNKCRQFQRTWWECCPRMVPKRVCCWCDAIPPEVSRRCLPICPRTSCTRGHEDKRLECANKTARGCQRIKMPCCRGARIPPNCHVVREPTDCEKTKCPFPSYSECDRMDPAVIADRPPECRCMLMQSACDAYRYAATCKQGLKLCPCPQCPKLKSN